MLTFFPGGVKKEPEAMEDEIMLQNWKSFQKIRYKRKLQMANAYRCNLFYGRVTAFNATLIINNGQDLEVRYGLLSVKILLDNLRGFHPEGTKKIYLNVLEPEGEPPIILEFANVDVQGVVLEELENFREIVPVPTPPTSSESDD